MKTTFCAGVFRENPGSDSRAQLILTASAGRAKGRAALLLRIFRDFKVQHFNSEQNLKVPRLPAFILPCLSPSPDASAPREDQEAPFLLAKSILHLNWLSFQLARKRRKVLASCFGVPCFVLAHRCTLPPRGTPALLGPHSPPGEHLWLSGIWHALFKAAW